MKIALLSDIHANLPAAEAALKSIQKHHPNQIVSLGDQVNLGPNPREVLALLKENGVTMLHGNHERYILSVLAGDPAYDGANFQSLHWNAAILTKEEITFPKILKIENVILTHALPEDDRFPVFDPEKALPLLRERFTEGFTHIICGHGHNPTSYRMPHLRYDGIGSTGCMDEGTPGSAPWTLLTLDNGDAVLQPIYVPYHTDVLPELYLRSGMVDYCPVMAHIACLQAMLNRDFLVPFVDAARLIQKEKGEQVMSMETWGRADQLFQWPDGLNTAAFWKQYR